MGAEAAVRILHRKRLAAASDEGREALRARLVEERRGAAGGVDRGLAIGVIDEVIDPAHTRRRLAEAIAAAPAGRGKRSRSDARRLRLTGNSAAGLTGPSRPAAS